MFKITQIDQFRGIELKGSIEIEHPISLIIGKNGAGKSRFFQSIASGNCTVFRDGLTLDPIVDIIMMTASELVPNFSQFYDGNSFDLMVRTAIATFKSSKLLYDEPLLSAINPIGPFAPRGINLDGNGLHTAIRQIAQKIGKKPSELTEAEISFHFEAPNRKVLGSYEVAAIFNNYVSRIQQNKYHSYLVQTEGYKEIVPYADADFIKSFGEPPWAVLNQILASVFDGKFHFSEPDIRSLTKDHATPLLDEFGRSVSTEELSTGEKTLLWLALSLFNIQHSSEGRIGPPRLLLLDEPDAYLHPKLVEKLYKVLTEMCARFDTSVLMITHSPTAVALLPVESIYSIENGSVSRVSQDAGIAELLDGVPQISIDPNKRRQVFVESYYDCATFQSLFEFLRTRSTKIMPQVSVTFVPAGPKMPKDYLVQKVRSILKVDDDLLHEEFLRAVNGGGNCNQVYGIVESLNAAGPVIVKGYVDWDGKNTDRNGVKVFGSGTIYAIENAILDPIAVLLQLHILDGRQFSIQSFCGSDVTWRQWLDSRILLQLSVDYFLHRIIGEVSKKDATISYRSGISLLTDKRYIGNQGHDLETKIISCFPKLGTLAKRPEELKSVLVNQIMILMTEGTLIPSFIEAEFAQLQK